MNGMRLPRSAPPLDRTPGAGPSGLDQRTALALDVSSWTGLVVMAGLGISVLPALGAQLLAALLCLCFGLLDLVGGRTEVGAKHPKGIFAAQAVVVCALLGLHPRVEDPFDFLFVILSIRVVLRLGLPVGACWIGLFWILSSVAAFWTNGREGIFTAVFNLGVYPLCGLVGYALAALARSTAAHAAALAELRRAQEQLRRGAVTDERQRLGRDLHDSVKQQVFAAAMQLGAARALLPAHPDGALAAVEKAEQATRTAGSELGLVIHELRSDDLSDELPEALTELARTWSRQLDAQILSTVDPRLRVSPAMTHGLVRIAQEALANISRHASAGRVSLSLAETTTGLALTISDDGQGFDTDHHCGGVGVSSMKERAHALGGAVTITSTPGAGTTVHARFPYTELCHD